MFGAEEQQVQGRQDGARGPGVGGEEGQNEVWSAQATRPWGGVARRSRSPGPTQSSEGFPEYRRIPGRTPQQAVQSGQRKLNLRGQLRASCPSQTPGR